MMPFTYLLKIFGVFCETFLHNLLVTFFKENLIIKFQLVRFHFHGKKYLLFETSFFNTLSLYISLQKNVQCTLHIFRPFFLLFFSKF